MHIASVGDSNNENRSKGFMWTAWSSKDDSSYYPFLTMLLRKQKNEYHRKLGKRISDLFHSSRMKLPGVAILDPKGLDHFWQQVEAVLCSV